MCFGFRRNRHLIAFVTTLTGLACSSPTPPQTATIPARNPSPSNAASGTAKTSPAAGATVSKKTTPDRLGTDDPNAVDTTTEARIAATPARYPWLSRSTTDTLKSRFSPPSGFRRIDAVPASFAAWLRTLPLLPGTPPVLLFDGTEKDNQRAQAAVVDIDVGKRDLQQCADAVMRLRAEYLRVAQKTGQICFKFTNGSDAVWTRWADGERPQIEKNKVQWETRAKASRSYATFKRYLTKVFQYAGSASLEKEMIPVGKAEPIEPGDVLIEGGFPGHAVIVAEVAENESGERVFLLLQSYMPAQQMHILKNPSDTALSPWYRHSPGEPLETPEWRFPPGKRRRFTRRPCEHHKNK